MRARYAIAGVCLLWIAAESGFSPTYFWQSVETSLADAVSVIDTEILKVGDTAPLVQADTEVTLAQSAN